MTDETTDVLALAYAQRQLVVVQRDEKIRAHRRRSDAASASDQTAAATGSSKSKTDGFPFHLLLTRPAVALAAAGAAVAVGAAAALKQSSSAGSSAGRVLRLRTAETADLQLPLGHPLFDTVYVGHPARPAAYYPIADFHQRAFEHKFSEALRLVTSLGATGIKVSAVQGWGREFSAGLRVDLPTAETVGANGAFQDSRNREFLYSAELEGSAEPVVPPDLVWFPHEDAWQEIARQRIEHGLRSFELHVTYKDDFSVTSELAADLVKAKFKLGGTFQRQQSTIWAITGKFAR